MKEKTNPVKENTILSEEQSILVGNEIVLAGNKTVPRRSVVAALIWKEDRFMICQRPAQKARGLLWEFVGGKVEEGETKEQALVRECREELAITVQPQSVFLEVTHTYPDIVIDLTLFTATIKEGTPRLLEHNDLKWITKEQIPLYEFCPADKEILKSIIALPVPSLQKS